MSVQAQARMITPAARARTRRRQLSDRALLNLFIWPTLILLIAMNVFPLFYSLYLSFTNFVAASNKLPVWLGADNYVRILTDQQLWSYFATSGKYVVFSVGLQT